MSLELWPYGCAVDVTGNAPAFFTNVEIELDGREYVLRYGLTSTTINIELTYQGNAWCVCCGCHCLCKFVDAPCSQQDWVWNLDGAKLDVAFSCLHRNARGQHRWSI